MPGSWEIEYLDNPEQFLEEAKAYLDSAIHFCTDMKNGRFEENYCRGKVILSLTFHSTELFLKALILKGSNKAIVTGHNLKALEKQYKKLYPEDTYIFNIPFGTEYVGMDNEKIKELDIKEPPFDQKYRYPTEKGGTKWEGIDGFYASAFLEELIQLRSQYLRLQRIIFPDKSAENCME
jgi:hypothetical protein